ncbi:iron chaperone [Virgibacillus oceani]
MEVFAEFLENMDHPQHRDRTEEVLRWVSEKFPNLEPVVKWNQPMFTDHGTYIIGFSAAKHHLAVAPELVVIDHFSGEIKKAGYDHTKNLIRMKWDSPVNFSLLEKIIEYNIEDKKDYTTFWR